MAEVKFRVHFEDKDGRRDHLDVVAHEPTLASSVVKKLRTGAIVVKVKRVRE